MLDSSKWLEFLKWLLGCTIVFGALLAIGLVYIHRTKERYHPNLSKEKEEDTWVGGTVFLYIFFVAIGFLSIFLGEWVDYISPYRR